jgi:hypothetical protein
VVELGLTRHNPNQGKTMTANEQHAATVVNADDHRTNKEVMRQYDRLRITKAQLVKSGALNGNATPSQVISELRRQIPPDLF